MVDFGKRVKAAEREAKAKPQSPQIRRKRKAPKTAVKPGQRLSPATEFKPGVSGNPGGRPAKTPITDAMREHLRKPYDGKTAKYKGLTNADVLAIKQFELAIEEGDMGAAKEIADRVEGKTIQGIRIGGEGGGPIQFENMTPEEKKLKLAHLLAKASKDGKRTT
jgi:hypothetical protein